jgi:hypothetical protein
LAWGKAYSELPDSPLKAEIYQSLKAFLEAFGEGFREAFGKAFGHICRIRIRMIRIINSM